MSVRHDVSGYVCMYACEVDVAVVCVMCLGLLVESCSSEPLWSVTVGSK